MTFDKEKDVHVVPGTGACMQDTSIYLHEFICGRKLPNTIVAKLAGIIMPKPKRPCLYHRYMYGSVGVPGTPFNCQ